MKVLLIHGGSCEGPLQQLRTWLEAQNCEVIIFDLYQSSDPPQPIALTEMIAECDAVIIVINSQLPLPEVQIAVLAANAKGKKILGVQLGKPILVEALEKFGSSSVPFNRELIVAAVCEDHFAWTDEDGEPREEPDTERHKCKKQKSNKNAAA